MQEELQTMLKDCHLCPRNCGVDRLAGQKGFCGVDAGIMVARAALHMWEEPCISGKEGSGAVFFFRLFPGMCVLPEPDDFQRAER